MPETIGNLLSQAIQLLKHADIDTPKLDALLMLEKVTGHSRERLLGYPETVISPIEHDQFMQLVAKRLERIPLAQIIGKREFFGRDFAVTRDTLDPRPDTETLIEAVFTLLPDRSRSYRILDLGTATGCILFTLLLEYPNASGIGIDQSAAALAVAKENRLHHHLEARAELRCNDWNSAEFLSWAQHTSFDLIVSNPPYIPSNDIELLQQEVREHEPRAALDGGADGLDCYRSLAALLPKLMQPDTCFVTEIGYGQGDDIAAIFATFDLLQTARYKDLSGTERVLGFRR